MKKQYIKWDENTIIDKKELKRAFSEAKLKHIFLDKEKNTEPVGKVTNLEIKNDKIIIKGKFDNNFRKENFDVLDCFSIGYATEIKKQSFKHKKERKRILDNIEFSFFYLYPRI